MALLGRQWMILFGAVLLLLGGGLFGDASWGKGTDEVKETEETAISMASGTDVPFCRLPSSGPEFPFQRFVEQRNRNRSIHSHDGPERPSLDMGRFSHGYFTGRNAHEGVRTLPLLFVGQTKLFLFLQNLLI